MDLNCRIQRHTGLTQTERHLRDYILRYPEKVAQMNARELAQASFTSPSAVIRFCQKFGYKGLKDFKADLLCAPGGQGEGETPDCNFPFGADTPFDQVTDAVLKVERGKPAPPVHHPGRAGSTTRRGHAAESGVHRPVRHRHQRLCER